MRSTMQRAQLDHRRRSSPTAGRCTPTAASSPTTGTGYRQATFAEVGARAERLAAALARLGVAARRPGGHPGLEPPGPLRGVPGRAGHGGRAAHAEPAALPRAAGLDHQPRRGQGAPRRRVAAPLLAGAKLGDARARHRGRRRWRLGLGRHDELRGRCWPPRSPASTGPSSTRTRRPRCVTRAARRATRRVSSTATGRSFLHALAQCGADAFAISQRDRILLVGPDVPRQRLGPALRRLDGRAPTSCCPARTCGADHIAALIRDERITFAEGVPTIWNDMLPHTEAYGVDFSSLRMILSGGSAVPRSLIEAYRDRFGVPLVQAWGMTETGPLAAIAVPAEPAPTPRTELDFRARTGPDHRRRRGPGGRRGRAPCSPGTASSVGELEARGPWVTGSYYREPSPERFDDGWLRTGDVGTIDGRGFIQLTDRMKDVIKSGGEWISSVELENAAHGPPRRAGGGRDRRPRRAVAGTPPGLRRPPGRRHGRRRPSWSASWPTRWPDGGCRSGGRSSTRSPRPASASSTRRRLRSLYGEGRWLSKRSARSDPRRPAGVLDTGPPARRAPGGGLAGGARRSGRPAHRRAASGGGNSNATFLLRGPEGPLVLRRPPAAAVSGTAHSMAREYRVLQALADTGVPAPRPVAFCEDAGVTGAPFLVMEHVDGVSITDTLPADYAPGEATLRRLGEDMVDGLAALHRVNWQAVGLGDFGRPEQFLERQVPAGPASTRAMPCAPCRASPSWPGGWTPTGRRSGPPA